MDNKNYTILFVEDESDIRTLYCDYLTGEGFNVIQAEDGGEGLDKIFNQHWDLLMLDIMLPIEDGMSLLTKVREDQNLSGKPVIMFTNLSKEDVAAKGYQAGADSYMIKSQITPDMLLSEVKRLLEKGNN